MNLWELVLVMIIGDDGFRAILLGQLASIVIVMAVIGVLIYAADAVYKEGDDA